MGATKSYEFSAKENRLAKYAKALAHPARVAILKLLATKATCQCGDVVKEVGLIKGKIEGAKVCYCIDEKEWKAAQVWINQLFDSYKGCNECC
jgi:DNA-binding transcriptional ArsR family regulator